MRSAMLGEARKIRARYQAIAPVETGTLRRSAKATASINRAKTPRYVGEIEVQARHAAAVEFGNRRNGRRGGHYLRKALGS